MKTELQEQVCEENETPQQAQKQTAQEEVYSSKEEEILAKLYQEQKSFITKAELKDLGFNVGFFSKLTVRGAKYGNYELKKAPSEKVFQVIKLA